MRYAAPLILLAILLSCAEAFIDIRAPEKDAAVLEAQPQTQVHLVFSSHLVSRQIRILHYESASSPLGATVKHLTEGQSDRDRHPHAARTMGVLALEHITAHVCFI